MRFERSLTAAIAWRLLKSKKQYGAVGTISAVSICALAVATAAIICVLSVFNGFQQVITSRLDSLSPDIMVTPAKGKVIASPDSIATVLSALSEVKTATPTLSDNALLLCNTMEMPVTVRGVDVEKYAEVTQIRGKIREEYGKWIGDSAQGDTQPAVIAIGVASRMRAYPGEGMLIFAPRRKGRVNMANPSSSFLMDSIYVTGIYETDQQKYDDDGVIMPIAAVRELLQYDDEASAIEISLRPGVEPEKGVEKIASRLGDGFVVRDRLRQQEADFRMVQIEKWVSFLLLGFILVIAGFNIISSLSMLVIEKERAISTLRSLGMSRNRIGAIFAWESMYVTLVGGFAGIILGVSLCLLQQEYGFIKIGGDAAASTIAAYPVAVEPLDIAATLIPVLLIGAATALLTAIFARRRGL